MFFFVMESSHFQVVSTKWNFNSKNKIVGLMKICHSTTMHRTKTHRVLGKIQDRWDNHSTIQTGPEKNNWRFITLDMMLMLETKNTWIEPFGGVWNSLLKGGLINFLIFLRLGDVMNQSLDQMQIWINRWTFSLLLCSVARAIRKQRKMPVVFRKGDPTHKNISLMRRNSSLQNPLCYCNWMSLRL